MDLGRKMKIPGAEPAIPVDAKEPKILYPGLTLSDEKADEFRKDNEIDLGDEFTATVKLRITSTRDDEYGKSLSFDVLSLDDVKGDGEAEDTDDAEEKTLGYKRPASKKEAPEVSAEDLED